MKEKKLLGRWFENWASDIGAKLGSIIIIGLLSWFTSFLSCSHPKNLVRNAHYAHTTDSLKFVIKNLDTRINQNWFEIQQLQTEIQLLTGKKK